MSEQLPHDERGRSLRRHGTLLTPVALAVLVLASAAMGRWSGTGAGSGTGATSSGQALTVTSGSPTSAVHPGATSAVALTIGNPNLAPIKVASLSLDTTQGTAGFAVDASHATCDVGALSFAAQTNAGSGWSVPATSGGAPGTLSVSLPGALTMAASAATACQGATFSVFLKAST